MKIFIFILTFIILPLSSAYAQGDTGFTAGPNITFQTDEETNIEDAKPNSSALDALSKEAEITVIEDKHVGLYAKPTVQNISRLYWNKNALNIDNDLAIDNFMLINECDIYQKFYKDDFEWSRIREAGRKMLQENKESFSHKFKMIVPVDLGRYDMNRKGFPLINKTAFKDLRRIEIGGNSNNARLCGKVGAIDHYPRNLILILNKPFSYEFVELDEHIAQAYIIRQKYGIVKKPKELQNEKYDRLAFARVRITFSDYQGVTLGKNNFPLGIMFGQLDGIDIFEDAAEKRLLTSVDYK